MRRILAVMPALFLASPSLAQAVDAQTVDAQGAAQLAGTFARYIGQQAFDKKVVAVAAEGDAYRITFDFKALAALFPNRNLVKFDFAPYSMLVKPLAGGTWNVSSGMNWQGSLEANGKKGRQTMEFAIPDGKFTGTYDPALAAFTTASASLTGMSMKSRDAAQTVDMTTGAGRYEMTGVAGSGGGVDFTLKENIADFVESVLIDEPESGLKLPFTLRAPTMAIDAAGKGVRSKPLLDLLAFAVANGDDAKVKANQAEFKALLTAALPLWERIDGSYEFTDFAAESPVGLFGAKTLSASFGSDGVSTDGMLNYSLKASDLVLPRLILPKWTFPFLPTAFDLNFGGANIDLDSMARKSIENFDLNREPALPKAFGDALIADFMAKKPKVVIGHSSIGNADIEVTMEGEMTFEDAKPNASVTFSAMGYDKIMSALEDASKDQPDVAQYVPVALMVKGFGKTLSDGRVEWVVDARADGSVSVNGVMIKAADPGAEPAPGDGMAPDEGDDAQPGNGAKPQE
jgi:hypothetical protein